MTKQTVTRRQKDISRLLREKKEVLPGGALRKSRPISPPIGHGKLGQGAKRGKAAAVLTEAEQGQMRREGITIRKIMNQIHLFENGVPYISLNRPCRIGDGIDVIHEGDRERLIALHDEAAATGRLLKFVPASGAASRMFADWYRIMEGGRNGSEADAAKLAADLEKYAFTGDLREIMARAGLDLADLLAQKRHAEILAFVLTEEGLGYGRKPKALLKFHAYPGGSRTALEEHLVEAALYVKDARKISRLHLTVSEEHRRLIREHLSPIKGDYEKAYDTTFEIGISIQESATNTMAVDLANRPFRLEDGRICFRPGGHGALLTNLNGIDGDIIFLKNIDNIVPDRLKASTVLHKKILGGYLVSLQRKIFADLVRLDEGRADKEDLGDMAAFCRDQLHIVFPDGFEEMGVKEKGELVFRMLNRPLRVCGMVKNEGEPGGGPFWVNEAGGGQSLQIIESIQVDRDSAAQQALWQAATHFNPVDLALGVRDFRGGKFDLQKFVDPQTASIAKKTEKGRELKALEHPGLWNGSMAKWNTVFVEVPVLTFNPVKTVGDLLRPSHQPA